MTNVPVPELGRRKRAVCGREEVVKKKENIRLHAHLFVSNVLSALTYASETSDLREQDEHTISGGRGGGSEESRGRFSD